MGIVLINFLMGNGLILPWTLQKPNGNQARGKNSNSKIITNYANFKVSTHIASAISSDNPFVMLALNKIQEAIVDDMTPP